MGGRRKPAKRPGKTGPSGKAPGSKSAQNSRVVHDLALPESILESKVIQELQQTVQKLLVFDSLGKTLTSSLDLTEVLGVVVEKLGQLVNCHHFALVLQDHESHEFYYEYPKNLAGLKKSIPLGRGILGRSIERGRGECLTNPYTNPLYASEIDGIVLEKPSSLMTLPILARGSVLGLLSFYRDANEAPFNHEDFRTVETFSDYLSIAVENARNYRHVQELTISDDLTKLYNARYLHLVLEREIANSSRYNEDLSLVFIDLDNFKQVNDQYGHMIGSQLLKEFGDFLLSVIRLTDVAIRYGGDEFVLILPRTNKKDAITFVERVVDRLHESVFLKSRHLHIKLTASFGISSLREDGASIDQLITAADKAMYVVKKSRKDGVHASGRILSVAKK